MGWGGVAKWDVHFILRSRGYYKNDTGDRDGCGVWAWGFLGCIILLSMRKKCFLLGLSYFFLLMCDLEAIAQGCNHIGKGEI